MVNIVKTILEQLHAKLKTSAQSEILRHSIVPPSPLVPSILALGRGSMLCSAICDYILRLLLLLFILPRLDVSIVSGGCIVLDGI